MTLALCVSFAYLPFSLCFTNYFIDPFLLRDNGTNKIYLSRNFIIRYFRKARNKSTTYTFLNYLFNSIQMLIEYICIGYISRWRQNLKIMDTKIVSESIARSIIKFSSGAKLFIKGNHNIKKINSPRS